MADGVGVLLNKSTAFKQFHVSRSRSLNTSEANKLRDREKNDRQREI